MPPSDEAQTCPFFTLAIINTNRGNSGMTEVPGWDQLWSVAKEGQSLAYKNIQEVSKIHTDVTVLLIKIFVSVMNFFIQLSIYHQS